jgi:hypothetical protein
VVGGAGLLRAEILLISCRSEYERARWVYVHAGLYNGLDETLDERIRYRIHTPYNDGPGGAVILAGPTCDSADILYRLIPMSCRSISRSAIQSISCRRALALPPLPPWRSTAFRRSGATLRDAMPQTWPASLC